MSEAKLFSPAKAGAIELKNRIVMAPLTRNRARHEDDAPHDLRVRWTPARSRALSRTIEKPPKTRGKLASTVSRCMLPTVI